MSNRTKRIENHVMSLRGRSVSHLIHLGSCVTGTVLTSHGIVSAYTQGDLGVWRLTHLDFVAAGRLYRRIIIGTRYTEAGLAQIANEFADEVIRKLDTLPTFQPAIRKRKRRGPTAESNTRTEP